MALKAIRTPEYVVLDYAAEELRVEHDDLSRYVYLLTQDFDRVKWATCFRLTQEMLEAAPGAAAVFCERSPVVSDLGTPVGHRLPREGAWPYPAAAAVWVHMTPVVHEDGKERDPDAKGPLDSIDEGHWFLEADGRMSFPEALVHLGAAAFDREARESALAAKAALFVTGRPMQTLRTAIPGDVKMFVWQRDGGQCVLCGSRSDLEFDHIIPLAMGGSNTARNLQLLCEPCNRRKAARLV